MKYKIYPVFIPHQGCNKKCIYCNQQKITHVKKDNFDIIYNKIIQSGINKDKNINKEIAFYGGSFTGLPESKITYFLNRTRELVEKKYIDYIRISTSPDLIDENNVLMLKDNYVKIIELGVQSTDDKVLLLNQREYDFRCIKKSIEIIKNNGIKLSLQIMPGLYGDNDNTIINTFHKTLEFNPDFIRIYPTIILKGTELEELFHQEKYKPLTIERTIQLGKYFFKIAKEANIPIIKFGLHSDINKEDVVAGPYHERLMELVNNSM